MSALLTIATIGRYEARLIFRSWGFRIFAGMTVFALTLVMVTLTLPMYSGFYFSRALSGAFPLIIIKLLNVFQGLMAVIIGTDFLKRDRKEDTTEVIYAHPFANAQYILGKFAGVFGVFAFLDVTIVIIAAVIHVFFSRSLFAPAAYLLYSAFLSLPTLVFMIGLTVFLGSLIRSQAAVYLLAVSYVFLSLVVVGPRWHFVLDAFGFHTPVLFSDFIGLGNVSDLVLLRGIYLLMGGSLVLGSTLLMKRLSQARALSRTFALSAIALASLAFVCGAFYLRGKAGDRNVRAMIKEESRQAAEMRTMALDACDIRLRHEGERLFATADLTLANNQNVPLKTIVLTLNPGLSVSECKDGSGALTFKQRRHLLTIEAREPVAPGGHLRLALSYGGTIDERYCYLDIADAKREAALRIWFVSIPKRYAVVSPNFVHLTPECGWYPQPGLPESLLFPSRVRADDTRFSLTVLVPQTLTAISQGSVTTSGSGSERQFVFKPETLLPQISLTIGRYDEKSMTVDGIRFGLYLLSGHDRFTSIFKDIASDLPQIIKQLKDSYEVLLGLNYPFQQFSLVEIPVQVTSYNRLWTLAQEQIQPQIAFLPEMGVFCSGADFRSIGGAGLGPQLGGAGQRATTGQRAGAGQRATGGRGGGQVSPKDIQRMLFNRFVQTNLIAAQSASFGGLQRAPLGIQVDTNSEASFSIFPNFLAYSFRLDIPEWPLLGYALESYLRERVSSQTVGPMRLGLGSTNVQEEINRFLVDHSLADTLRQSDRENKQVIPILQEKGKALWILIRAKLGTESFDDRLLEFLKSRRFQPISRKAIEEFIARLGNLDLDATIASWYKERGLPGFLFDNVESYRVINKEKTNFQIKFEVTNPTDIEGVIKVNLATQAGFGGRGGGGMGGFGASVSAPETRTILIPAKTVKDVGIVLERASAMTTIDTSLSRNLPGLFALPFSNQQAKAGAKPFDQEIARPYAPLTPGADGEYIIDNEDPGFILPEKGQENWLRRTVRRVFVPDQSEEDYLSVIGLANPPENWEPFVTQNFFGRFVRSAYIKKSGVGLSKVGWRVNLAAPGSYNIYFYYEGMGGAVGRGGNFVTMAAARGFAPPGGGQFSGGQRGGGSAAGDRAGGRGANAPRFRPGKRHFLVHHDGRTEEVIVDLRDAQPGWSLIGNFQLAAGENFIEMTDKNDQRFVLADAIKWVLQR
jgi:hypothetical protein